MSYRDLLGSKYFLTIGLEIHAELNTETKMFSGVKNDPFNGAPNQYIDPVTMAMPGSLPVVNKKALWHMVRIGIALGGKIANYTRFDRKHYFYPDIPKGYQISQHRYPIVSGGNLVGVDIERVHLEEDTANNKHIDDYSAVDFNRAGVPLMELVTKPVIHDPAHAVMFAKELQLLLRTLGASNADMEKGEMRLEANVSVSDNPDVLGVKVELKNINSFSFMEQAIWCEVERMIGLYEEGRGDEIVQETRGWDSVRGVTYSQRVKESSEDYRYFPDPDLPPFFINEIFDVKKIADEMPELPWQTRKRLTELGVKVADVEMYVRNPDLRELFEGAVDHLDDKGSFQTLSNFILSDIVGIYSSGSVNKEEVLGRVDAKRLAGLINMFVSGEINSRAAKLILKLIAEEGVEGTPEKIAKERNLKQVKDEKEIAKMIDGVLSDNLSLVERYLDGDTNLLNHFLGQVMKVSNGRVDPGMAREMLIKKLEEMRN